MTIEQYARAIAEAVMVEVRYIAKDAYREFPWDNIDAIIASVPKPDVQARYDAAAVELVELRAELQSYRLHIVKMVQAGADLIDEARADEREACARIVEEWRIPNALDGSDLNRNELLDDLADDIRARSGAKGA